MQSFLVMYSIHQLWFCLQPYSRVSTTFKPKFKPRNVGFEIFEVLAIANEEVDYSLGLCAYTFCDPVISGLFLVEPLRVHFQRFQIGNVNLTYAN